jgi:DNA topoisomerase IA/ssDNA-binding Zn-finger/Zn-ribbon topoisomerase 1
LLGRIVFFLLLQLIGAKRKNLYFAFPDANRYNKIRSYCNYYSFLMGTQQMTSLMIVESEAKAKAVTDQTGGRHETLVVRSAPMKISHVPHAEALHTGEAGFQFVPAEGERDFVRTLLTNLHRDICLALDSDTRGESWSWMLHWFLLSATKGQKGIRRIHVSGFSAEELAESLQAEKPVQGTLAASQYVRSLFNGCLRGHLNRLLGATSGPGGLPLHFPVLTTLFLLDEQRAKEAVAVAPARWQVRARLAGPNGGFTVRLREAYEITDDGFFRDEAQAHKARELCDGRPFVVQGVTGADFTMEPPPPYRLAELLHDGFTMLGMGPAAVMHALQKLYGGLPIGGRHSGLISSPAALLPFRWPATLDRLRREVEAVYGSGQVAAREPEGHVILPLLPGVSGEALRDVLGEGERRLYELIRTRALASQMPAARGRHLTVQCAAGRCLFEGQHPALDEKGFLQAFPHGHVSDLLQECPLRQLTAGMEIREARIGAEPGPAAEGVSHTFISLLAELADFAVPAEAGTIIMLQEMIDRDYLDVDHHGFLHLRENGGKVVTTLHRAFPAMKGINLSAYFAQTVEEVTSGRKPLDTALKQFDQNFVMHGVPLVRAPLPKAVAVRETRSRNIIKSPEPAAVRPQPAEGAILPAEQEAGPPAADEEREQAAVADRGHRQEGTAETALLAAAATGAGPAEIQEVGPQPLPAREEGLAAEAVPVPTGEPESPAEELAAAAETPPPAAAVEEVPEQAAFAGEPPAAAVAEAESGEDETAALTDTAGPEPPPVTLQPAPVAEVAAGGAAPGKACPVCGRLLLLKSDRFGRFWSCSGYPACRHTEACEEGEREMELLCPLCHKESLVIKPTPGGKQLYVCSGAGCEFMAWSRPHALACPRCGSPFLVEKKTVTGRMILRCPRAGCSYSQPLAGTAKETGAGEAEAAPAPRKVLVRRRGAGGGKTKKVLVRRKG